MTPGSTSTRPFLVVGASNVRLVARKALLWVVSRPSAPIVIMGDVPRCIRSGFDVCTGPLGYPKRSKHACIESDSSDDEVDERFPAFRVWRAGRLYRSSKPYAQHCTAPSSRWTAFGQAERVPEPMQRLLGASAAATLRGAARAYVRGAALPRLGAPRHNGLLPPRKVAPPAPECPWRPQPPPPPLPTG